MFLKFFSLLFSLKEKLFPNFCFFLYKNKILTVLGGLGGDGGFSSVCSLVSSAPVAAVPVASPVFCAFSLELGFSSELR